MLCDIYVLDDLMQQADTHIYMKMNENALHLLSLSQMSPIQVKPADSEIRGGK